MRILLLLFAIIMSSVTIAHADEVVEGSDGTTFEEAAQDGEPRTTYDEDTEYESFSAFAASCHKSVTVNPNFRKRFKPVWESCAPGCKSPLLEILPSEKHCKQKTPSCHHTGNAADIHKVKCGSKTYTGKTAEGIKKFTRIVKCFKGAGWTTYWQDAKHIVHFHLQRKDCVRKKGCCKNVACLD